MEEYKDTETKPRLKLEELAADLKEAGRFIENLRLWNEERPPNLEHRILPNQVEEEQKFTNLNPKGRYKKPLTDLGVWHTYLGEWVGDLPDGFGIMTFPEGNRYEGAFKNGQKHGYGKFFWTDGDTYEGDF
jgi:MORN repeat